MDHKKILFLNYEFPPLGGGAANATYYIIKEFEKYNNIEVVLVTSSVGKYKKEKFSKNITIYYLDIGKSKNLHSQSISELIRYTWRSYKFCQKLIKQERFDLIHAFFGVPCGFVARKLGLPYIVSLRGSDVPGCNPALRYKIIYTAFGQLISKIWRDAKLVISNSIDLRDMAYKFDCRKKIQVIPNGIDSNKFHPGSKKDDIFRILYVGRLHPVKGVDTLINGFKIFSQNKSNVELLIVGDGPMAPIIAKMCQRDRKINYLGYQSNVRSIYQKSNVFVLLSFNEGMSNSMLEAMASGLAIVTTNTGGSSQLISDQCGIIVSECSEQALSIALEKLYNEKSLLNDYCFNSRQVAESLNWQTVAKQYFNLYKDL